MVQSWVSIRGGRPSIPPSRYLAPFSLVHHHLLNEVLRAIVHQPRQPDRAAGRLLLCLAKHARRAKPQRDRDTGQLKLWLAHIHATT